MARIRVAVAGVGNACSIFVQALQHTRGSIPLPNLWHDKVGGLRVSDIDFVAAFDVDPRKVGLDLSRAMTSDVNVAPKFVDVKEVGLLVEPGLLDDPVPSSLKASGPLMTTSKEKVIEALRSSRANLLVNLISSGAVRSSKAYAEVALQADCCFVNATPAGIAGENEVATKFSSRGLVVVGDDMMSQFGGTVFHRGILDFLHSRGVQVRRSYQLDVGGGQETLNTIDEDVRAMKRQTKTLSIASELPYSFESVAGTTDYVDYMGNQRTSYFWIEGEGFFGSPIRLDIYLRTTDGPNAGNVLLDVVRAVAAAHASGSRGAEDSISSCYFKSPPHPKTLRAAQREFARRFLT